MIWAFPELNITKKWNLKQVALLYNVKENESYVDTRMRIHNGLNRRSLLCLAPAPDSVR